MSSLYSIATQYQEILSSIGDELNEEELSKLNKLEDDLNQKAINIAGFIKNLECDENAIRQAISSMSQRLESIKKKKESLIDYLKMHMEQTGMTTISWPYFVIKIKKNPISVVVHEPERIPSCYKKITEIIGYDKALMKKDIENGVEIAGVELEQKTRLEIK